MRLAKKYAWPTEIGESVEIRSTNEKALRTSATAMGSRYGVWLGVRKTGTNTFVVTRLKDTPVRARRERLDESAKQAKALAKVVSRLRQEVNELREIVEELRERFS